MPLLPAGVGERVKTSNYMANNNARKGKKKATKSSQQQQRRQPKRRSPAMSPVASMDNMVLANHWRMIRDPCNATLAESAYPGRAGMTSRFTGINTYTAGSDTAFLGLYNPAAFSLAYATLANSASTVAPVYGTPLIGQSFLFDNADSWRVIGFCLDIEYVGTELSRSGVIYGGVLPANTVPAGVSTSVDTVKVLLSHETRTPDRQVQLFWFPGVEDQEYHDASTFTDTFNGVVLAMENMPAGVQVRVRHTTIVEWLPKAIIGMSMPSPVGGSNPPAAYERLHAAARNAPGFVDSLRAGASERASQYAYNIGQRSVDGAVGAFTYALAGRRRARAIGY